jgi:TRAP-type C4-dicarboxylate transport system substrate-binding protein
MTKPASARSLTTISFLTLLLAVGVTCPEPAYAQSKEIRFANFLPASLPQIQMDQWFADELAKRSGGNVKMRIFAAGSLGKPTELLKLVAEGGVDAAATAPGYFPAQMPFLAATNSLPLAYKDAEQSSKIIHTLYNEIPALKEEMRQNNVHPLFWHVIDPYYLVCRTPVRTLADLKGKRVRSWGEDVPRLFKAVDAVPISLLPAELYEALQRGTIDCAPYSMATAVSLKLHEVAKYVTFMSIGAPGGWPQFYNLKAWESWPSETKKLFMEIAEEAKKRELEHLAKADKEARETMKAAGVEFIDFPEQTKLEALAPDFIAEWVRKMEGLGKGTEATKMAQRWKELQK